MNHIDKRAMDHVEHHKRTRELNSRVFARYFNGGLISKYPPSDLGRFNCHGEYILPKREFLNKAINEQRAHIEKKKLTQLLAK